MFEAVLDAWPDPVAPPLEAPEPWELTDDDTWVEALTAGDPDRPLTVAEILAACERGPIDPTLAAELSRLDPARLSDDGQIALAVAAARYEAHYHGVKLTAVAAFAGPSPRDDTCEGAFAWAEIGPALSLGERGGRRLVDDARRLRYFLPRTLAALRDGKLNWAKLRCLLDATIHLSAEQCAAVEDKVLDRADERTTDQHYRAVTRAARNADPEGWAARRQQKRADVALIRHHHGDGVADVLARNLDSCEAETIWTGADTWARRAKAAGDPRTLDALRVAALVEWAKRYLTGADNNGVAPTRGGEPATVNVTIPLPSLVGADDTPGMLHNGEPVPVDAVADLLEAGAKIRFALLDHNGHLAGISTTKHDPTALMRVWVALRDITVRVPTGSTTPVAGQDVDHINPRGPTDPANLHAPSRGWHRAKTFGHWTLQPNADGTITWTSKRTGRSYTTQPYNHRDGP